MTRFRWPAPVVATCLLTLLAGCAGSQPKTDMPASDKSTDVPASGKTFAADEIVIQAVYVSGYTTPTWIAARLPIVTVYGDGRIITQGPQITIYPAPALPSLQVQRIPAGDVGKLAARALAAGVGSSPDFGQPTITDMPSTVITVLTADGVKTTDVYALQDTSGFGLNEQQKRARTKLRDLIDALTDPGTTLGTGMVTPTAPYRPAGMAAVVTPYQNGDNSIGPLPEIAWPGSALPGDRLNSVLHCVTVTGNALELVVTAAQKANVLTPWKSAGKVWLVTLRPLLPHESGCGDLSKAR